MEIKYFSSLEEDTKNYEKDSYMYKRAVLLMQDRRKTLKREIELANRKLKELDYLLLDEEDV